MRTKPIHKFLWLLALCLGIASHTYAQQIPLPTTLLELQHSPSPYECGVLSEHTYKQDMQPGDPVVVTEEQSGTTHTESIYTTLKTFEEALIYYKKAVEVGLHTYQLDHSYLKKLLESLIEAVCMLDNKALIQKTKCSPSASNTWVKIMN